MRHLKQEFFAILGLFVLCAFVACVALAAEDEALVAKGKELFDHKEGLNVKIACILCHKGSKALDPARISELGDTLPQVINKYMVEKAKGAEIAADSEEMKALAAYLRSGQS